MTASWLVGGLSPEGVESYAALVTTLARLADQGEVPPCAHPLRWHLWTSDDAEEREAAAHACTGCPALAACEAHGQHERHGVWAEDRTPRGRRAAS